MTARLIALLLAAAACWLTGLGAWYAAAGLAGIAVTIIAVQAASRGGAPR